MKAKYKGQDVEIVGEYRDHGQLYFVIRFPDGTVLDVPDYELEEISS